MLKESIASIKESWNDTKEYWITLLIVISTLIGMDLLMLREIPEKTPGAHVFAIITGLVSAMAVLHIIITYLSIRSSRRSKTIHNSNYIPGEGPGPG